MASESKSIAQEAEELVKGSRRIQYGSPVPHFSRVANVWSVLLGTRVSAQDVAACMMVLKLLRESSKPNRDNRVDAIGYMLVLDEIQRVADTGTPAQDAGGVL